MGREDPGPTIIPGPSLTRRSNACPRSRRDRSADVGHQEARLGGRRASASNAGWGPATNYVERNSAKPDRGSKRERDTTFTEQSLSGRNRFKWGSCFDFLI